MAYRNDDIRHTGSNPMLMTASASRLQPARQPSGPPRLMSGAGSRGFLLPTPAPTHAAPAQQPNVHEAASVEEVQAQFKNHLVLVDPQTGVRLLYNPLDGSLRPVPTFRIANLDSGKAAAQPDVETPEQHRKAKHGHHDYDYVSAHSNSSRSTPSSHSVTSSSAGSHEQHPPHIQGFQQQTQQQAPYAAEFTARSSLAEGPTDLETPEAQGFLAATDPTSFWPLPPIPPAALHARGIEVPLQLARSASYNPAGHSPMGSFSLESAAALSMLPQSRATNSAPSRIVTPAHSKMLQGPFTAPLLQQGLMPLGQIPVAGPVERLMNSEFEPSDGGPSDGAAGFRYHNSLHSVERPRSAVAANGIRSRPTTPSIHPTSTSCDGNNKHNIGPRDEHGRLEAQKPLTRPSDSWRSSARTTSGPARIPRVEVSPPATLPAPYLAASNPPSSYSANHLLAPMNFQYVTSASQIIRPPTASLPVQGHPHIGFTGYLQPQAAYQKFTQSPTTGLTQVNFTHGQAVAQGPTFTPMEGLRKQHTQQEPSVSVSASASKSSGFTTSEIDEKKYDALRRNQLEATGMSANYKGDPWLSGNRSAEIPDDENTALWLTNLPPDVDYPALLGAIRDCGKVYACVINYPVEGKHATAACKLVFFDTIGARRLLGQSRAGVFRVPSRDRSEYYKPRVGHNRIKSRAREPSPLTTTDTHSDTTTGSLYGGVGARYLQPAPQSRCLLITGPSSLVNEPHLSLFFRSKFDYQLESVATL